LRTMWLRASTSKWPRNGLTQRAWYVGSRFFSWRVLNLLGWILSPRAMHCFDRNSSRSFCSAIAHIPQRGDHARRICRWYDLRYNWNCVLSVPGMAHVPKLDISSLADRFRATPCCLVQLSLPAHRAESESHENHHSSCNQVMI
jgi:hypothetical protein